MKFVYQHLKIKADTAEQTADLISSHTQEVERVWQIGIKAKGVVSGQIRSIKQHPQADRLQILEVEIGDKLPLIILTGAAVNQGEKVAVAVVGARVVSVNRTDMASIIDPEKTVIIQKQTIRGVESWGMLCGEDELGLSLSPSVGVMILPAETPIGLPLEKIYPTRQIIETDDKGTAHRSDLLSYRGMELELAAILGKELTRPDLKIIEELHSKNFKTSIEAPEACRLFITAIIDQPKIKKSPDWLIDFLNDNQVKTINLATDITNYVMLTEGYPTHVFDADTIEGSTVSIRRAKKNECVETLNHQIYNLEPEDVVIADSKNPMDLAGIIGGRKPAVDDKTNRLLLTCALFNPVTIRRTSQSHGIRTEASARFERGLSVASAINGFNKALQLILDLGEGQLVDRQVAGEQRFEGITAQANTNNIRELLGIKVSDQQIISILTALNFQVKANLPNLSLVCPWWRQDIHNPQDIAREIARIYGYDRIPTDLPSLFYNQANEWPLYKIYQRLRQTAAEFLYEVETSSMVNQTIDSPIVIANPIGDKKYLRNSLQDGLVNLTRNRYRENFTDFGCFEIGYVYSGDQPLKFAAALVGPQPRAKELIGLIFHRLGLDPKLIDFPAINQSKSQIIYQKKILGEFRASRWQSSWIFSWELDLEKIKQLVSDHKYFQIYSKFPKIRRDLAIVLPTEISYRQIIDLIKEQSGLITLVDLFDEITDFSGRKNSRSLAFHLEFISPDRTLQNSEVNQIMQEIIQALKNNFKADIR